MMPRRNAKASSAAKPSKTVADSSDPVQAKTIEEEVLRKIYALYRQPTLVSSVCGDVGIEKMAKHVGLRLLHPSKRVSILLIGNHSAGKSSFINWYTKEELQNTGVAVESQGFTICTQGQRSDMVRGMSCIEMKPYLKGIEAFKGVVNHLEVRVSKSNAREFGSVDFIDSPGLIDGNVSYPFPVNDVIMWLAQHMDLIFVFMDPVGQALCTRTMAVVNALDKADFGSKMSFFITKADQVPRALDRQTIITQTVANLSRHVTDQHGLKVNTMWIPGREGASDVDPASNYLGHLVDDIQKTVKHKAQVNMERLQADCSQLSVAIDTQVEDTAQKLSTRCRWLAYQYFLGWVLCPLVIALSFLDFLVEYQGSLPVSMTSAPYVQAVLGATAGPMGVFASVCQRLSMESIWHREGIVLCLFLFLYTLQVVFAWRVRRLQYRSKQDLVAFRGYKKQLAVMKKCGADIRTDFLRATQRPEGE